MKTRYLGLVVGTAISGLVDKPELRMDFKVSEMSTPETQWYLSLTQIRDDIGSLHGLRSEEDSRQRADHGPSRVEIARLNLAPSNSPLEIREISFSTNEDVDLIPYSKVDADPEDEEDDPMTAHRNKPTAPV